MPFQDRLNSPIWRFIASPIVALALAVCVLATTPAWGQQVQSYQRAPQTSFRDSVANLGRSFRARPNTNRIPAIETANFVVYANDELLARKVSKEAERFRKELSIEWLGREIPTWRHKCPIKVEIGPNAGGETSFAFITNNTGRGEPIDWSMKIYGPPDRVLDAVLPHEVTHTIFATHFGRPLPRWADEGACTTVEHESERRKNHRMLLEFLTSQPSRGIPFNRMFTMRNYPHDILPLYAQGYSLARFLIAKEGRRHFVDYVGKGLENEGRLHELRAWDQATQEFYQYKDLSELQVDWLAWVKNGSNDNTPKQSPNVADSMAKSQPNFRGSAYSSLTKQDSDVVAASFVELAPSKQPQPIDSSGWSVSQAKSMQDGEIASASDASTRTNSKPSNSWYIREMNRDPVNATQSRLDDERPMAYTDRVASSVASPLANKARKVPSKATSGSKPPVAHDSRLPQNQFGLPPTLWR